jgi:proteasome lid subunit RPN8/RPN11
MEAGVVVDKDGQPIFWHEPEGRSVAYLPDSRTLWQVIWDNRENIMGVAHSHPGGGRPGPSWEDVTTFSAIELALGKRLEWWIITTDQVVVVRWFGPDKYDYGIFDADGELIWLDKLRKISYQHDKGGRHGRRARI